MFFARFSKDNNMVSEHCTEAQESPKCKSLFCSNYPSNKLHVAESQLLIEIVLQYKVCMKGLESTLKDFAIWLLRLLLRNKHKYKEVKKQKNDNNFFLQDFQTTMTL